MSEVPVVLAIDPGQHKCGVSVVKRCDGTFQTLHAQVAPLAGLPRVLSELASTFQPAVVVVGNGTNSAEVVQIACDSRIAAVETVDERFSTILARKRFFEENPPRGLRRLIPLSLQTPNRPYDDYVAVILAERYLAT